VNGADHRSTLVFSQYYIDCLSQASYLVGDAATGRAVVIDPRRDVSDYLADAQHDGLTIVGSICTHFHADFVSGHLELAAATGAWIGFGKAAVDQAEYEIRPLVDGERIVLGDVALEILETPGHTPESICVLVYEHLDDEVAWGVLTGDTLFVGDVGRPDLLASAGLSADTLSRWLFDSVHHKLMGLPDAVRLFPGHGAGSACGKNLSTERQSTIGDQRVFNYACQPMTEDAFVELASVGQPLAPDYFAYDVALNQRTRTLFDGEADLAVLTAAEVEHAVTRGAVVLDARESAAFATGHRPGSINVPADGRLAETAGTILAPDTPLVVVAPEREREVVMRLARVGFDTVIGAADLVDLAAHGPWQVSQRLTGAELDAVLRDDPDVVALDVRSDTERESGFIPGSLHIPLPLVPHRLAEIPPGRVVVYCASGRRSSVVASVLRAGGRTDVTDLADGFDEWQAAHARSAVG
jgi:glyoxylase-like metal-dependent hydrolase (beta-lactamase superfamily II)/rhodanese-related sulfurtransferase